MGEADGPVTLETVLVQIADDPATGVRVVPAEVLHMLADEIHRLHALLRIYRTEANEAGDELCYEGDADTIDQ